MDGKNLIRIPCSSKDEHEFVLIHASYAPEKDYPLCLKLIGSEGENVYTTTSITKPFNVFVFFNFVLIKIFFIKIIRKILLKEKRKNYLIFLP